MRLRRWAPVFGAVALVAVVAVVVTVVRGLGDAACAAVPAAGQRMAGKATYYDGSQGGNCSYGPPSSPYYVALSRSAEYTDGAACGAYLDVTGPKGTIRVQVVDSCPPCAPNDIDLSPKAFAAIAEPVQGIVPVTYQAVRNPRLPAGLSFRVKEGSSRYWLAILPSGHGNALRSVAARTGGGDWVTMERTDYGYWVANSGAGGGPFSVRVTDVYGNQQTVSGLALAPEQWQRTSTRLYGAAAPPRAAPSRSVARPTPTASRASASASPSAVPSRSPVALLAEQGTGRDAVSKRTC